VAVIDGYAHMEIALGILQQLHFNLVLFGLELDLIRLYIGQAEMS